MITHEEALEAAGKLTEYCVEHFRDSEEKCVDCTFWRKEAKRCILPQYMGCNGEEIFYWAYAIVQNRYKELTQNE